MARCVYCGKPAGLLRRRHPECQARHSNAYSVIPQFFGKVIDSAITAQRFSELLQAAARESFVDTGELKALCKSGFSNVMTAILNKRPPTAVELRRVGELVEALGANFPGGLELDELITKAAIVSDLGDGRFSDCVAIAGPVPIAFEKGEMVLWIFNQVAMFRLARNLAKKPQPELPVPAEGYFSPPEVEKTRLPDKIVEQARGDLVVTNRKLCFLRDARSKIDIPFAGIKGVQPYADAVQIVSSVEGEPPRIFLVDDPWFATNLIYRLMQLARGAKTG
jgi:hypothetical protein